MAFEQNRDKEIRMYQDRIRMLQQQNNLLKNHSCFQHQPNSHHIQHTHAQSYSAIDPYTNSIFELAAKNQKLEREAEIYQRQIKRQLTQFIRQSNLMKDCSFRRKYMNALSYPPPKLVGLRR